MYTIYYDGEFVSEADDKEAVVEFFQGELRSFEEDKTLYPNFYLDQEINWGAYTVQINYLKGSDIKEFLKNNS